MKVTIKGDRIFTKGNIEVQNIKLGDILYEFEYSMFIKSQVITLPDYENQPDGRYWTWQCKCLMSGRLINYGVHEKHSHYAPNLYDNEAYFGCRQVGKYD